MSSRREFFSALLNENYIKSANDDIENTTLKYVMLIPAITSLTLLSFGFTKAFLGCCFEKLDKWMFDYVQSLIPYEKAGRLWKIFINLLLFIILPLVFCSKCCISKVKFVNSKFKRTRFLESDSDAYKENLKLLDSESQLYMWTPSAIEKSNYSSETLFERKSLRNPFEEADDEEFLVKDTDFVVRAMNESHESLNKVYQQFEENATKSSKNTKFVDDLIAARIVYRRFSKQIGGVNIKDGQSYSIRGYFLPSPEKGYQFVTYSPLKQVYTISNESVLVPITPPIHLDAKAFRQYYKDENDIFNNAGELNLQPSLSSPCINIVVQDSSMYLKKNNS